MKCEIYIRNTKGDLFIAENNPSNFLMIKKNILKIKHDKIILGLEESIIETFNNNENAKKVYQYLYQKMKEQKDLRLQIQAIKKIKGLNESIIEKLKSELRNDYFEFKIIDICKELNIEI